MRPVPCCLCQEPGLRRLRGFIWCRRHAENLLAVLAGELDWPGKADRPRRQGRVFRTPEAREAALLQCLARFPDGASAWKLADTLGWNRHTTGYVLRELRKRGAVRRQKDRTRRRMAMAGGGTTVRWAVAA